MTVITRFLDTTTSVLGPNRVEAIAGTSQKARDGHVVVMAGLDTRAFLRSGTILWNHAADKPVAVPVSGYVDPAGILRLVIDFPEAGTSACSDEVRALVKAGIVRNLSIGFNVLDAEPLDPRSPRGGLRITRSELLEVSFCSVPADTGAVVTARDHRSGKMLSGTNASALREAHDHAERCRSAIASVLDGAGEGLGERSGGRYSADRRRREAEALALRHLPISAAEDRRYREAEALRLRWPPTPSTNYRRRQAEAAALRIPRRR